MKPTNIEEIKTNIECSLSSVYSKDDVLNIITMIESFKTEEDGPIDVDWLKEKLIELRGGIDDIDVDESDVEFSIQGREIYVEHITINGKDDVLDSCDDIIRELNSIGIGV
jgi:hypothetical protein